VTDQGELFRIGRKRTRGRSRRTLDETLTAMRALGRVETIDSALIGLARVAADELDDACRDTNESRYTRGVLVARYHAVLSHLLERPDTMSDDIDLDAMFAAVDNNTTT